MSNPDQVVDLPAAFGGPAHKPAVERLVWAIERQSSTLPATRFQNMYDPLIIRRSLTPRKLFPT